MGTTQRFPLPFEGGGDLFWKEQGEMFLATSGIKTAVIKPCGLTDGAGGKQDLLVGPVTHATYLILPQLQLG